MRRVLLVVTIVAVSVGLFGQAPTPSHDKPEPNSLSLCTVSGRVVSAPEGKPLKSALVALEASEHFELNPRFYTATSNTDGDFVVKDVPAGRYVFLAAHPGYVSQQYQAKGASGGSILALQPGQELKNVMFRLVTAAVIAGRVSDEDGTPMTEMRVVALRRPTAEELDEDTYEKPHLEPTAAAPTDDRGQFRIFGLTPGDYYLKVTGLANAPYDIPVGPDFGIRQLLGTQYLPVYYPGVLQPEQAQTVVVKAGDEAQVDFTMLRARTVEVSGRVIGADGRPATFASVSLLGPEAEDFGIELADGTDAQGKFRVKGVPPGSYTIMVSQNEEGHERYRARQQIEVGSENIDSINLFLGRGSNIRGRVTASGPGSTDLARMHLLLLPVHVGENLPASCRISKDGTFELTDIQDGSYVVRMGAGLGWYMKSARLGSTNVMEHGLQVEKGGPAGNLEIIVSSESAQLNGLVTLDDKPLPGAHVRLTPDPETLYNRARTQTKTTDQTGQFSIDGIAPGKYRIVARFFDASKSELVPSSQPQIVTLTEHGRQKVDLKIIPADGEQN